MKGVFSFTIAYKVINVPFSFFFFSKNFQYRCGILSNAFFLLIDLIFFIYLLIWWIILLDFQMVNLLFLLNINWSCCFTFYDFYHFCYWFANTLLTVFTSTFIRSIDMYFSRLILDMFYFLKELYSIGGISFLNVWKELLLQLSRTQAFFLKIIKIWIKICY